MVGWLVVITISQAVWVAGWSIAIISSLGGWLVVIIISQVNITENYGVRARSVQSKTIIHLRSTSGEGKRGKTCAVKF